MRIFFLGFWTAARIFLGGVFIYSGFFKLLDPVENFQGLLADYTIIPYALTPIIARFLPWLELSLGVFVVLGLAVRWSSLALSSFSLGFVVIMLLSKWILGISPESCGCFGEGGIHLSVSQMLVLDAVNFVLGVGLFLRQNHPFSLDTYFKK